MLERQRPTLQVAQGRVRAFGELLNPCQHGAGTMDEERPQIGIALFGDASELSALPAAGLAGGNPEARKPGVDPT